MEFVSNALTDTTLIKMEFAVKLNLNARSSTWLKAFVKVATKVGKSLMANVFKLISSTVTTEDAKPGKMENVLNAQKDGISMKTKFVLQSVIYVIPGVKTENVIPAIKAMLSQMDNVLKIQTCLFQVLIAYVLNGKKENV